MRTVLFLVDLTAKGNYSEQQPFARTMSEEVKQHEAVLDQLGLSTDARGSGAASALRVMPDLQFAGWCEEAFEYYAEVLDGEVEAMMRWSDTPMAASVPREWQRKIAHASMRIGTCMLWGSDSASPKTYKKPQGFAVGIQLNDAAKAERIFALLAHGERITMPLAKTSWADRYGTLVDRYQIPWQIMSGPEDKATDI